MNNIIQFSVMLWLCNFFLSSYAFAQTESREVLQILLVGDSLDKIHFDLDGNNLLINGKAPEELGIAVEIVRKKADGPQSRFSSGVEMTEIDHTKPKKKNEKPYLGITSLEEEEGLLVLEIHPKSAARKSGLRNGDIIQSIDGKQVLTHKDLLQIMDSKVPGDPIYINFKRRNSSFEINFRIDDETVKDAKSGRVTPPHSNRRAVDPMHDAANSGSSNSPIGLVLRESTNNKSLRVIEVKSDSRAQKAGVKVNDIVLSMNGKKATSLSDAAEIINNIEDGEVIKLKISRAGKELTLKL